MVKRVSDEGLERFVLHGHGYAVVCFFDYGSVPCSHFKPEWAALDEMLPEVPFYEIDAQENPGISKELGVIAIPTVMLFWDGQIARTWEGPYSREALLEQLRSAMSKKA